MGGEIPYRFETPGDTLSGLFLGEERFTYDDGKAGVAYRIGDESGDVYLVNGSYELRKWLSRLETGFPVSITYTHSEQTRRGLNPVKKFKVGFPQAALREPEQEPAMQPAMFGGMTQHDASPFIAPARRLTAYLPDGTPAFGFDPDTGEPLDAYGKPIVR